MEENKGYQWSGVFTTTRNGVSINENFTFRLDTMEALVKARMHVLDNFAPTTVSFPNDEGSVARTETQETAPLCPVHGTPKTWKPAGVTKAGKAYPAFFACNQRNADGSFCKGK